MSGSTIDEPAAGPRIAILGVSRLGVAVVGTVTGLSTLTLSPKSSFLFGTEGKKAGIAYRQRELSRP